MSETDVGLSVLPDGWVWTTLGEICESALKTQPKERPKVEFTYIDIASIDNHLSKIVNPKVYVGKDAPSRARQVVRTGDTLFSTVRTYLKNIALVSDRYDGQIASTGFCIIRPLIAATEFIFWMTLSNGFLSPLNKIQRGTSYPAVRDSDVFSQMVPLPPENEQIRIVAKIEELFTKLNAGKEELLQAKARLKRYRQSVLKAAMEGKLTEDWRKEHRSEIEPASILLERILKERREKWEAEQLEQMMAKGKMPKDDKWKNKYKEQQAPDTSKLPNLPKGWVWTTVGEIAQTIHYGYTESATNDPVGPKFLRITDIQNNSVNWDSVPYCRIDGTKQQKYLLKEGDLVFARTGATVGKSFLIRGSIPDAVFASYLIRIVLNKKINANFVYTFFQSQSYWVQIHQGKVGIGQPNVNAKILSQITLPLPSLSEQQAIVFEVERRLSVADAVEATVDAELKRSDALRQSILKQAFSCKLVPQDPNEEPASVLLEQIKEDKMKRESEQKSKRKSKKTRKREKGHTKIDDLLSEKTRNTRIYDALKSVGQPLPPDELLKLSKLDVDEFYAQLKTEIERGRMVERRPDKTSVFLEIKNET